MALNVPIILLILVLLLVIGGGGLYLGVTRIRGQKTKSPYVAAIVFSGIVLAIDLTGWFSLFWNWHLSAGLRP